MFLQKSDHKKLIGTWHLVKLIYDDGRENAMLGKEPEGYLVYGSDGFMVAQMMRQHDKNNTSLNYFGYGGTFTVDEKEKIVTHHVKISSIDLGKTLMRSYRFEGNNKLYLRTIGDVMEQTIVWERFREGKC